MSLRQRCTDLRVRSDLNDRVGINPDEAGLIERLIAMRARDRVTVEHLQEQQNLEDEIDLITDTAINPNAEVVEIEYELADSDHFAYVAHLVGYPADSDDLSKWCIFFYVRA